MIVRPATTADSAELLEWRNDSHSRQMSFDEHKISNEEHDIWFKEALSNPSKTILIGESDGNKIGVCSFDLDSINALCEVSINMNPEFRGKKLSKLFLKMSINYYRMKHNYQLLARIKNKNIASKKIFYDLGFEDILHDQEGLKLILKEDNVSFKEIVDSDIDILYKLLKSRKYSISHQKLPDYEQHKNFVLSKPYDYWYLLYSKNKPIGTLYVKSDNSVGINIENPSKELIGEVISFVKENFLPNPELESKIPPYFYINISKQNIEMQNILLGLSLEPIQISFKLN